MCTIFFRPHPLISEIQKAKLHVIPFIYFLNTHSCLKFLVGRVGTRAVGEDPRVPLYEISLLLLQ